jgi:hypothetical protein
MYLSVLGRYKGVLDVFKIVGPITRSGTSCSDRKVQVLADLSVQNWAGIPPNHALAGNDQVVNSSNIFDIILR